MVLKSTTTIRKWTTRKTGVLAIWWMCRFLQKTWKIPAICESVTVWELGLYIYGPVPLYRVKSARRFQFLSNPGWERKPKYVESKIHLFSWGLNCHEHLINDMVLFFVKRNMDIMLSHANVEWLYISSNILRLWSLALANGHGSCMAYMVLQIVCINVMKYLHLSVSEFGE